MDISKTREGLPAVRLSARVLYGWLLRFYAMGFCVLVLAGRFLVDRTWPSPLKFWLCIALGAGAIAHTVWGPSLCISFPEPVRLVISPLAALGVVGMTVACGIFGTWIIIDSP